MKKTTFRTTLKSIRKAVMGQRNTLAAMLLKPRDGFVVEFEQAARLRRVIVDLDDVEDYLDTIIGALAVGK